MNHPTTRSRLLALAAALALVVGAPCLLLAAAFAPARAQLVDVKYPWKLTKLAAQIGPFPIAETPIGDATIFNSAAVPQCPNAKMVVFTFLPSFKMVTKAHSMVPAPTTAPPLGTTWQTPMLDVERRFHGVMSLGGRPFYVSPETLFTEHVLLGYHDPAHPNPTDYTGPDATIHQNEILPDLTWSVGLTPGQLRGYAVEHWLGDGSGVPEQVVARATRFGMQTTLSAVTHGSGIVNEKADTFRGYYIVAVWDGVPN